MDQTEPTSSSQTDVVMLTSDLVSAFVGNNVVSPAELPGLISSVHAALSRLGGQSPAAVEKPLPAVSVKKSITPDHIFSLEDGRPYKSLKRHLAGRGLTPAQYRAKWSLPADYPMTSPNYSATRSALAKSLGLGRKPAAVPAPAKRQPRKRAA